MTNDTISSDDAQPLSAPAATRTAPPVRGATALTLAVSLVLVGGVATAAYRAASGEPSPTTLVPSNAFAYAQIDLSRADSGDAAAFAAHFPAWSTTGRGGFTARMLRSMMRDSSIDYDREVKPWLGDRAAVAGWVDREGRPQYEVVLRADDTASARQHLRTVIGGQGLAARNGYIVIAPTQQLADEALSSAKRASLQTAAHYRHDISQLPGGDVAQAWFDGPATKQALRAIPDFADMTQRTFPPTGAMFTERLAVGLRVSKSVLQVDVRGTTTQGVSVSPSSWLTKLPGHTLAALEVTSPGRLVDAVLPALDLFGGVSEASSGTVTVAPVVPYSPSPGSGPALGMSSRGTLRVPRQACAAANGGMSPCNFVPGEKCSQPDTQGIVTCRLPAGDRGSFTQPIRPVVPPPSPLAMVRQFTGLTLPGDFEALLGDRAVIAFGGLELTSAPDVVVRSHPRDLSKARSLADRLRSTVARKTGVELAIRVSGDDLVVASNSRYADRVIAGGDVGAEKRFRAAMGAMPDQVSDAGYVDLSSLLGLFGAPRRLRSLDSVGFWDRVEGGAISGQLRLVLR